MNLDDPERDVEGAVVEVKLGDMERLVDGLFDTISTTINEVLPVLTDHVFNDPETNLNHAYLRTDSTVDELDRRQLTLIGSAMGSP